MILNSNISGKPAKNKLFSGISVFIISFLVFMSLGVQSIGQATLPVTRISWASTPTGWTDSPLQSYLSAFACTGNDGGKFAATGDYNTVFFNSSPNQLSFTVKSNTSASTSVLLVEESPNGTAWTTVVSLTGTIGLPTSCTPKGPYTLLSTSRYVRWSFTKGSSNMTWDDVSITVSCSNPVITAQPGGAQSVCVNGSLTPLSVTASPATSYQWYSNTTATTTGGTLIPGATSSNYTPSTLTASSLYYYCIVSDFTCTTTSAVSGLITVGPAITGTLSVAQGSTITLSGSPAGGTWSSGTTSVATVDPATGVVTGVAAGTSVITYSAAGCSNTVTVTCTGIGHFIQIESILVDACDGTIEGENEMVGFRVESDAINVADIRVDGAGNSGVYTTSSWPNNLFLGWIAPGTPAYDTAVAKVGRINASIINCGKLIIPTGGTSNEGILPAGKKGIVITSTDFTTTANDFTTLTDTLYVVFQNPGNTLGHFVNYSAGTSMRYLRFHQISTGTNEDVAYDKSLLLLHGDGDGVKYTAGGAPTYYNSGCVAPFTLTYASVSIAANPSTVICPGTIVQFTSTIANGGSTPTYQWQLNGANIAGATSSTYSTTTLVNSDNITCILTSNKPCISGSPATSNIFTASVNLAPQVTLQPVNQSPCAGGSSNFAVTASGTGITYQWQVSTNGGTIWNNISNTSPYSGVTTNTLTVNPVTSGMNNYQYHCVVSGTCNPAATSNTAILTVTIMPSATASDNDPCAGQTLNLTSNGGISYNWAGPNSFSSAIQNPAIASVTLAAAGTYTVTVTAAGGCSATAQTVVTVNSNPVATASSNTPCSGQTLNLISGGGTGYSWSGPNSFSNSTQNPSIPGVTSSGAGTYIVTVTNASGCSATAQTIVTVNAIPAATASSNSAICTGQTLTLFSSGGTGYSWSGPSSFSDATQNPTIPNAATSATGTYIVTVSNANGCTASAQTVVSVTNTPAATASSNSAICSGQTLNLSSGGGSTYSWSGPNSFTSSSQNPTIAVATPAESGTYTVTVTAVGGCSAIAQTIVTVNTNPTATASSNSALCEGQTLNLTSSGGSSYSWAGPASFSSAMQNPSLTGVSTSTAGIYTVTVSDANGCSSSAQTSVTVNANPTAVASSNSALCEGQSLNLTSSGGTSYSWSGPNSFSNSTQNPSVSPVTTADGGIYIVTVTNASGCTATAQTIVTVNTNPIADASSNSALCEGQTLNLASSGGSTYNWSGPNSFSSASQNPSISSATPINSGTYTVTVTDAQGCSATDDAVVVINALPTVTISGANNAYCLNAMPAVLNGTPSGGSFTGTGMNGNTFEPTLAGIGGPYDIVYFYTDINGCSNSDTASISVIAMPTVDLQSDPSGQAYIGQIVTLTAVPGNYSNYIFDINTTQMQSGTTNVYQSSTFGNGEIVYVFATEGGCTVYDSLIMDIKPFPNAFTPDANGKNDVFLKGLDLQIANRWGELLYEGKEGWDGTFNGKTVSPGTYYYIVKLTDIDNNIKTYTGSVTLIDKTK